MDLVSNEAFCVIMELSLVASSSISVLHTIVERRRCTCTGRTCGAFGGVNGADAKLSSPAAACDHARANATSRNMVLAATVRDRPGTAMARAVAK